MHDPDDRFGMPPEAIRAARESHGLDNPVIRWGSYVPTRREVATLAAADLMLLLDGWFWESPTELIPSSIMVREVRAVLAQRPDAATPAVLELIELCDDLLEPDETEWQG